MQKPGVRELKGEDLKILAKDDRNQHQCDRDHKEVREFGIFERSRSVTILIAIRGQVRELEFFKGSRSSLFLIAIKAKSVNKKFSKDRDQNRQFPDFDRDQPGL